MSEDKSEVMSENKSKDKDNLKQFVEENIEPKPFVHAVVLVLYEDGNMALAGYGGPKTVSAAVMEIALEGVKKDLLLEQESPQTKH